MWGAWDWGLGGLAMVLLWMFVAGGAVWFVLTVHRPRGERRARRILEERFARGEIDAEEMRVRLRVLEE